MSEKNMILKLKCPNCNSPARAEVKKKSYKFLIYVCPNCDSNVVCYNNKVDILSDKFVEILTRKNKLQYSGRAIFPKKPKKLPKKIRRDDISKDNVTDLKILLNTEKNFESFLSKI
jgi:hypothetical protein